MMLVIYNVRKVPSKMKKKGTIECDKSTIIYDLVLYNVRIVSLNVRKNKGTSECDNSTDISDVSISQCEDSIMKSEEKKGKCRM